MSLARTSYLHAENEVCSLLEQGRRSPYHQPQAPWSWSCLVTQSSSPTLCDPWTAARSPSLHHLPGFAQAHVHWVGDASNHLILCCPLLLLPLIFPSIRVFSNESTLHISWPKYCSFSISPSSENSGLISFRINWFDFDFQGLSRVFSSTTVWKHQFFGSLASLLSSSYIRTWLLEKPQLWLDGPLLAK